MKYQKHVFICTNQRPEGARICCGDERGHALVAAFKKELKDKKLNVAIRAQKAGCLETCELGPSVVVYPEGIFYGKVQLSDVQEIVHSHLENDIVVERLLMDLEELHRLQNNGIT